MAQQKIDKQSFVVYNSFFEAAKNLNGDDFKECFFNLRDYALFGIDKETDNWAINIILSMAKPLVASARKRYENCVENGNKGKDYGKNGGRPKKTLEEKPQAKPLNVNANVYDSEKENYNVTENSNVCVEANNYAEHTNNSGNTICNPSSNNVDSLQLNEETQNDYKQTKNFLKEAYRNRIMDEIIEYTNAHQCNSQAPFNEAVNNILNAHKDFLMRCLKQVDTHGMMESVSREHIYKAIKEQGIDNDYDFEQTFKDLFQYYVKYKNSEQVA
jgi:hypothetical protein